MNVLWAKQKFTKLQPSNTHASGDAGSIHCCKICGSPDKLRSFEESDCSENNEKYYQLINYCFGIKSVSPSAMICEKCGRNLRKINKFRILVHAAFDSSTCSGNSSNQSQIGAKDRVILRLLSGKENEVSASQVTIIKRKLDAKNYRHKRGKLIRKIEYKKLNLPCTVCGQKYMMVAPSDGLPDFVCSRCKCKNINKSARKKCFLSNCRDVALNAKNDLKGKSRLYSLPKKPLQSKNSVNNTKNKDKIYQCAQCPNKYALAQNLAAHVNSAHGYKIDCLCAVCGKDLKTRKMLEEHVKMHTGKLFKCEECGIMYEDYRALQNHVSAQKCRSAD